MAITNREAFEQGTDAFNAHDVEGFADVLADASSSPRPGMRGEGKAACAAFYAAWFRAFPDARVEVDALHSAGDDDIVEEGTFTGTHDGVLHTPTGNIPPTGRAVSVAYIHVLRLKDGRRVAFGLMFDRLEMLEQLGLVPAPAG